MAITTTREQRRVENHERALAAYMEHHAAAVALIARIQVAVEKHDLAPENHDLAPDSEAISWGTVGSMQKTRQNLQALSDWLFDEGEYAEGTRCESGWTGDRCTFPLHHHGPHSNE